MDRPRASPASGLPALAQIQQAVYTNLLSLPPMLQAGFDRLRLDAEKVSAGVCGLLPTNDSGQLTTAGWVPAEAASNASALADMLIATNTVHSFQLGDGDGNSNGGAKTNLQKVNTEPNYI
jgi:hypothetical protein